MNDEAFSYFSDTVGVCMKSDLPACLSHRERLFIVNTMVKDFKEIFTAMEELIGYQYNINVSGKYNFRIRIKTIILNDKRTVNIFPVLMMLQFVPFGQVSCCFRIPEQNHQELKLLQTVKV